jgi:phosphate uptake regulator
MQFFSFLTGSRPSLLDQSLDSLGEMLDIGGAMFTAATATLLDNEALEMDLSAEDERINAHERQIRLAILQHVSADPRADLSLSLVLVSIVQDAERIGDLAKSLAKAALLSNAPRMGRHVEALRPLRDRIQAAFPTVREAFRASDLAMARSVMEEHDENKLIVARYLEELAQADDVTANEAVVLAVSGRMIGRTGSHLSNIISAVAMPFDEIRRSPNWVEDETGATG